MSTDKPNTVQTPHGVMPEDRVVERKQGCWNCRHRETGESVERRWSEHKAVLLAKLRGSRLFTRAQISMNPEAMLQVADLTRKGVDKDTAIEVATREQAGKDPRRDLIDKCEVDVRAGVLGRCAVPGGPVGQDKDTGAETNIPDVFIHYKYLCRKWSAASGASVARGTDRSDELPAELRDRIDGAARSAPWANNDNDEEK